MKNSNIEWCDHTFNAWEGCTMISPGCANCYAAARNKRYHRGKNWGAGAPRLLRSDDYWKQPLKWNQTPWICDRCGLAYPATLHDGKFEVCWSCLAETKTSNLHRARVFCSSLADWLDEEGPIEQLARLLTLIHYTPNLVWLLLTKRPQNWYRQIKAARNYLTSRDAEVAIWLHNWLPRPATIGVYEPGCQATTSNPATIGMAPSNVWIGTTAENQEYADRRIPDLLEIPARIHFLSCEPLLGPICLSPFLTYNPEHRASAVSSSLLKAQILRQTPIPGIDWVICGGESGRGSRPMDLRWAQSLRDQCLVDGVPFFFKQWGEMVPREVIGAGDGTYGDPMNGFLRVGKKDAGRTLDGRTWDEFPRITTQ